MDTAGIDVQVVFPTGQLSLSRIKETDLAARILKMIGVPANRNQ